MCSCASKLNSWDFKGNDSLRLTDETDELGAFSKAFTQMVDTINNLVLEECEAEIQLQRARARQREMQLVYLRSQINPHFLYNTLGTIQMKAAMHDDDGVVDMIHQLILFFRNGMEYSAQIVSLHNEIEMVRAYLNIMRYRFPNVQAVFELDETLLDVDVPNFILQPLVENSFKHGLKEKCYRGEIRVVLCDAGENRARITIINDGIPVDEEQLQRIEDILKNGCARGRRRTQAYWAEQHPKPAQALLSRRGLRFVFPRRAGRWAGGGSCDCKTLRKRRTGRRKPPCFMKKKTVPIVMPIFFDPPLSYRGAPFWAWNCAITDEDIDFMTDMFKQMGMGGAHLHSRTGMALPYLQDAFMQRIRHSVERAEQNGMRAWLYDEDRWPSDTAADTSPKRTVTAAACCCLRPNRWGDTAEDDKWGMCANGKCARSNHRTLLAFTPFRSTRTAGCKATGASRQTTPQPQRRHPLYAYLEISGQNPWFNDQAYAKPAGPSAVRAFLPNHA